MKQIKLENIKVRPSLILNTLSIVDTFQKQFLITGKCRSDFVEYRDHEFVGGFSVDQGFEEGVKAQLIKAVDDGRASEIVFFKMSMNEVNEPDFITDIIQKKGKRSYIGVSCLLHEEWTDIDWQESAR
ncbi:hypothetical protein LFL96_25710 [Paraburkholderia sp. D15]|uniref:hypothetical protein n=1 Tax=Paraburkholderia sp. D15 TaxID=2880218 RepID=UPI00247A6897|nr:hypothetical protein [Paraburkholderia sp. D15]WGS54412.1 hypothetical protein LFL96_25710 [Paraburkholderia sp. D15]